MALLAAEWSLKPRKQAGNIKEFRKKDRLSALPDELLMRILRYLPAVEVIRTGSLSRRWRHLPSLFPVQDRLQVGASFCPRHTKLPPHLSLGLDAIDRAMTMETSLLNACEIVLDAAPNSSRVQLWASGLARRGVRELVFDLRRRPGADASPFVTSCRSLLKLDVLCGCLFPEELSLWFPSIKVGCLWLTHLKLVEVEIRDSALLAITSACTMLTRVELIGCRGLEWLRLEEMQRLKDLIFQGRIDDQEGDLKNIDIDAPNLEVLDLRTLPPSNGFRIFAPKVRTVYLSFPRRRRLFIPAASEGLRQLLQRATNVGCLQLRAGAVDCLSVGRQPDNTSSVYPNLSRLYVNLPLKHERQALCLTILLQQFTTLEQLNIYAIKWEVDHDTSFQRAPDFSEHEWRLQEATCIQSSLKHVTISGYMGDLYELNFVAFILNKARVLKKMTLNLGKKCSSARESAARNLVNVVRASPNAKLIVKRS